MNDLDIIEAFVRQNVGGQLALDAIARLRTGAGQMSDLTKLETALGQRDAVERDNIALGQRLEYAEARIEALEAALREITFAFEATENAAEKMYFIAADAPAEGQDK